MMYFKKKMQLHYFTMHPQTMSIFCQHHQTYKNETFFIYIHIFPLFMRSTRSDGLQGVL